MQDISEVIAEAANAALPVPVEAEAEEPIEAVTEIVEAEVEEPEAEAEEPAGPELPEGYVAPRTVEGELATQFTISDTDGEIEVPDVIVTYKANGKVRQDRLDKVVKFAQYGVYNEQRESRIADYDNVVSERDRNASLALQREQQMERMLLDDDFFYNVKEAYETENSPERRVERAEAERDEVRMQAQMAPIVAEAQRFYGNEVLPAIEMIAGRLPGIEQEELAQRFTYAMSAHLEEAPNGQRYLPSSRYDEVRKYIIEDLAVWAQIQHARRGKPVTEPKSGKALDDLSRARIEAQKAKRTVGRALKPVGRATGGKSTQRKISQPTNLDDAVSSALDSVMAGFK